MENKENPSSTEEKPKKEQAEIKINFLKMQDKTVFGFQKFEDGAIGIWWADKEKGQGIGLVMDAPDLAQTMSVAFQRVATELSQKKSIIVPSGGKIVKPKLTIKQ